MMTDLRQFKIQRQGGMQLPLEMGHHRGMRHLIGVEDPHVMLAEVGRDIAVTAIWIAAPRWIEGLSLIGLMIQV